MQNPCTSMSVMSPSACSSSTPICSQNLDPAGKANCNVKLDKKAERTLQLMKPMLQTVPKMAKQLLKSHFSGEVLAFLEDDLEEN